MEDKLYSYLERIATALEQIAQNTSHSTNINVSSEKKAVSSEIIEQNPVLVEKSSSEVGYENILSYLNECGISITNICNDEEISDALKTLALFMGDRYDEIADIYKKIKARLSDGKSISVNMKGKTQEEISASCQFCNSLYRLAFLTVYKYQKSPIFQLYARPSREPKVINFLTGHWFELYIKTLMENEINYAINSRGANICWSCLSNPQIKLPNGDYFELDILFSINDEIFWFEVKTGTYQDYIGKYSKISNLLNINEENRFLVLLNVTPDDCLRLSKVFEMNVVPIINIKEVISQRISTYWETSENESVDESDEAARHPGID